MSLIIVGGGMAGATLALAISRLTNGRLPVTLIEATAPGKQHHPGYDARAIALSDGTCRRLMTLGLWKVFQDVATPIRYVHVSDRGHGGFVTLDASQYGLDALGQVVGLRLSGQRLYSLLQKAPGIRLCCPATVVSLMRDQQQVTVVLNNGEQLHGKLLVAADGTRSSVAAFCGIRWHSESYGQLAAIAHVGVQDSPDNCAWERFTVHGPLALLPVARNRYSLVWCLPLSQREQVAGWDNHRFLAELQQAFGWRLGRFTHVEQRDIYPLRLHKAGQHVAHRLALVGNAAQTLHPVAGQGFNLGMRDVMTLAETLSDAFHERHDIGSFSVLAHYQKRRIADQRSTIHLTDGLVRLFASDNPLLQSGRHVALMAMAHLPLLQKPLAKRLLGWGRC